MSIPLVSARGAYENIATEIAAFLARELPVKHPLICPRRLMDKPVGYEPSILGSSPGGGTR